MRVPFFAIISAMLIKSYAEFVARTDLSKNRPDAQFDIAVYGLVGEIGSLVAAIKKRLLAAGRRDWNAPNDEIVEELGDSLWYCFAVAAACGMGGSFLDADVSALQAEVGGTGPRSDLIRDVLGARATTFLQSAPGFHDAWSEGAATLDDYRRLAFLTSRTKEDQLVEVSLAVLQQLTAELLRSKLPTLEKQLNQTLKDRPILAVLGETIWHMAALASLYGLDLGNVAERNMAKLERRFGRGEPTPLHDEGRSPNETLPRLFEVSFVAVGPRRSRMYMNGNRLGDDLTDNAYMEDGYRFHDVMHLALAAKLGWSPVLRKLMGKKRKSDAVLDEVEDGARAQIVEEAIIKAIHAEGVRIAALVPRGGAAGPQTLFANSADMSFNFLKRLEMLVAGLEAESSRYWEWEDAILIGFRIFDQLRGAGRGTVVADLVQRSLTFFDHVFVDIPGSVASVGAATLETAGLEIADRRTLPTPGTDRSVAAVAACRSAVLNALHLPATSHHEVVVQGWRDDLVDVRVTGSAQRAMWDRGVVAFRAIATEHLGFVDVTAFAISDT